MLYKLRCIRNDRVLLLLVNDIFFEYNFIEDMTTRDMLILVNKGTTKYTQM